MERPADVVVIGGGLGGLTAARRLAAFGRQVTVLEQGPQLGGLAAWFRRGPHVFDTALHGFPHAMVKTCRKYWCAELADRIVRLDLVRFANPRFSLDTDFTAADFRAKLTGHFGAPPEAVDAFLAECRALGRQDPPSRTVGDLFAAHFPARPDVWRFLLEPVSFVNGSGLQEPAFTYGIVMSNFLSKGIYFFRGGTDLFLDICRRELLAAGVRIRLRERAVAVEVEGGAVRAVVTDRGRHECRAVICNANLRRLLTEMLPAAALPPEARAEAASLRLSHSIAQVYLGLRAGAAMPFLGDIMFSGDAPDFSLDSYLADPPECAAFSFYYDQGRPGSGRQSIVASVGARHADWAGLPAGQYADRKRRLVEHVLGVLERRGLPDVRAWVDHAEAATPLTFERYTLHPLGATFGTRSEGLRLSEGLPGMVRGLFHAGSTGVIMSGWLGAANYGAIVAGRAEVFLGG